MDRGAWQPTVHRVAQSWTQLKQLSSSSSSSSGPPWASLVAHTVKYPPAMRETLVRSLGWEDPLKEGMATHSSIPVWRIPRAEEPGRLQPMGSERVRHNLVSKQ